jgi:hypothetical protein
VIRLKDRPSNQAISAPDGHPCRLSFYALRQPTPHLFCHPAGARSIIFRFSITRRGYHPCPSFSIRCARSCACVTTAAVPNKLIYPGSNALSTSTACATLPNSAARRSLAFLSHLATDRHVAASTQNQALSAILFLYCEVLKVQLSWLSEFEHAPRSRHVPSCSPLRRHAACSHT